MDNAQKAIMIGVGLFITIIVIAAVMLITGMGQDLLNSGTQQLGNISSQLESQLTQEFDNKTMTGAQVLAALKQYYNHTDLIVGIQNYKGGLYTDVTYEYMTWVTSKNCYYNGSRWKCIYNDGSEVSFNGANISKIVKMKITEFNKTTPTSLSEFSNKTSKFYISSNQKYKSVLITANDAVVGIYFFMI